MSYNNTYQYVNEIYNKEYLIFVSIINNYEVRFYFKENLCFIILYKKFEFIQILMLYQAAVLHYKNNKIIWETGELYMEMSNYKLEDWFPLTMQKKIDKYLELKCFL